METKVIIMNKVNKIIGYAQAIEKGWERMMAENGYIRKTTFMSDFIIAEVFGQSAVWDTYKRAEKEWFNDKVYCTELAMVLNHLAWLHHDNGNTDLSRLYSNLWEKIDGKIAEEIKDEEFLEYYYRATD